ncbi:hypothetical protein GQ457_01G030200 [Hibiscus cannabinus]
MANPIRLSSKGPPISHLFFADDMVLFSEASLSKLSVINSILKEFCLVSGHKVSIEKTNICFSRNVGSDIRHHISSNFGFREVVDLGKYLGVPLLHSRVTKASYDYIIQRVRDKLSGWDARCLSLAGRITLAKAVLSSIPFYSMQSALLPRGVTDEIEKIIRSFIWGHSDARGVNLVGWDVVCQPTVNGGLGIKNLHQQNLAFIMKVAFNLIRHGDHLWVRVLRGKYKMLQTIPYSLVSGPSSHLWKAVCSVWETVRLNVVWNIGDGQQVDFWYDSWLGSLGPLAGYVRNPNVIVPCTVAAMVDDLGNWDWPKLQSLLPHSVLLHLSATNPPRSGFKGDFPGWARSHDRNFSVRAAYEALRDNSVQSANVVWKLLAKDKLLCNAERVRRHLSSCARCEACGAAVESTQHIFRGCPIAVAVWKGLIKRDKWVEFMSLDNIEWIRCNLSSHSIFAIDPVDWDLRFGAILWSLWLRRYAMIFDPENLDMLAVSDRSLWLWNDMKSACALEGHSRPNHTSMDGLLPTSRATARWVSPLRDWFKVNVDGARDHSTGLAACGGLIRDHEGRWVRGFARSVGVCSPIES